MIDVLFGTYSESPGGWKRTVGHEGGFLNDLVNGSVEGTYQMERHESRE